ncbi:PaaI family thioesterase [Emticicia sp. BO119]|uniref:PaaI family thioesterase n=1 Tax=Emticicia sp. BO119 TaxID=2757768 RepID=UPI0015F01A55|nr:PaaI family thioesterase [Emticicia sp. BO119]MBA4851764.1 PaaI family thioesterase [Emticicia sp. BO119]
MNPVIEFFKANIGKYAADISPSSLGRWMNGKLIAVEEGSIEVEFVVREEMTNPLKILHGGTAASMLDDVMGMTVYMLGRETFYTTVNLSVDYLSPAKEGDTLLVKSNIIRAGKTVIHITSTIYTADKKIVAKCTSNMVATGLKI